MERNVSPLREYKLPPGWVPCSERGYAHRTRAQQARCLICHPEQQVYGMTRAAWDRYGGLS